MRKFFTILAIVAILFCAVNMNAVASTNKPLKNLGQGLDDIVYGQIEVPDSIDETHTKGAPAYSDCTSKTNDDVGRGIARFVGGLWRIATFWYPEEETAAATK